MGVGPSSVREQLASVVATARVRPATAGRLKPAPPGASRRNFRPHTTVHLSRELSILDAMRMVGLRAEAALAIRFVVLVVALEPHDLAVAFEGQHVRGDPIEEPP